MNQALYLFLFIFISCELSIEPKTIGLEQFKENNCDKEKNSKSQAASRSKESLVFRELAAICQDTSRFSCDVRVFSPETETENLPNQEFCLTDQDCLTYQSYHYNTVDLQNDSSNPKDFEIGGQYNYKEVQCWMITKKGIYGQGNNLKNAIHATKASCHKQESKSL